MKKKEDNLFSRIYGFFYEKLFKINDSAQRIALGFGLGVFLGIFPGTGPVASLFLAVILRINRASALIGCLLTNTWISFITFILAIKAGSVIMGTKWEQVYRDSAVYFETFKWANIFKLSVLKVVFPVFIGYISVGFCFGLLAYLVTQILILMFKHK